jgi:hypothetical protein
MKTKPMNGVKAIVFAVVSLCLLLPRYAHADEYQLFILSSLPYVAQDPNANQWCWAATTSSILQYYDDITVPQCNIANLALGRTDCCASPASCNVTKTLTGTNSVAAILNNLSVGSTWLDGYIAWDNEDPCVVSEIYPPNRAPFYVGLNFFDANNNYVGGHLVVANGYEIDEEGDKYVINMDPNPDNPQTYGNYAETQYDDLTNGYVYDEELNWTADWVETLLTSATSSPMSYLLSPQNVTNTSATLYGLVNPKGISTNVYINYYQQGYPATSTFVEQTDASTPVQVSTTINGLAPNTTYYYLIETVNSNGTNFSTTMSFKTSDYTLAINKQGTGTGTVNYTLSSVNGVPAYVFTATPAPGSIFTGWSGTFSGTANPYYIYNVSQNLTIYATFMIPTSQTINVGSSGNGTISPSGPLSVNYGSSQTFSIIPSTGSSIIKVNVDGQSVVVAGNSYTIPNITAPHTIFAFFTSTSCIPLPDGDVNGDGVVNVTDALLTLRAAVGLDPITPQMFAHGDVAPLVNGIPEPDGQITTADALGILSAAVGLINLNSLPCETQTVTAAVVPASAINPLSSPSTPSLALIPSGNGSYTIQGTNMNGVASIQMSIAYDTSTLGSPSVTLGSLASGALLGVNTTTNPGFITIGIMSTTPFSGSGPIAVINFATWNAASALPLLSFNLTDINGNLLATSSGATTPSYMVTGTVAGSNGTIFPVSSNQSYNSFVGITITPNTGYYLSSLTDNGTNVTSSVNGNVYWLQQITGPHNIIATFAQNASPPSAVPALGPWGMLISVAGIGILMRRRKPKKTDY